MNKLKVRFFILIKNRIKKFYKIEILSNKKIFQFIFLIIKKSVNRTHNCNKLLIKKVIIKEIFLCSLNMFFIKLKALNLNFIKDLK